MIPRGYQGSLKFVLYDHDIQGDEVGDPEHQMAMILGPKGCGLRLLPEDLLNFLCTTLSRVSVPAGSISLGPPESGVESHGVRQDAFRSDPLTVIPTEVVSNEGCLSEVAINTNDYHGLSCGSFIWEKARTQRLLLGFLQTAKYRRRGLQGALQVPAGLQTPYEIGTTRLPSQRVRLS